MKGPTGNNGISRTLLAWVMIACGLLVFSVWMGCRLWSFRQSLVMTEETNAVLQEQLAMAADTLTQVSSRMAIIRGEMEAAPPTARSSLESWVRTLEMKENGTGDDLTPGERRVRLELASLLLANRELARQLADAAAGGASDTSTHEQLVEGERRLRALLRRECDAVLSVFAKQLGCNQNETDLIVQTLKTMADQNGSENLQDARSGSDSAVPRN